MKAIKFKLFATVFTLAAVLTASTFDAYAQRRSEESTRQTTEKRRSTNSNRQVTRSADSRPKKEVKTKSGTTNRSQQIETRRGTSTRDPYDHNRTVQQPRSKSNNERGAVQSQKQFNTGHPASTRTSSDNRVRSDNRENSIRYSEPEVRKSSGRSASNNRDFYRVDRNDNRYSPNSNYRGSDRYWSGSSRSERMNYNRNDSRYYRNYNYVKRSHWDRSWERYRWNYNSWRDYYRGYNPRSYVYSRYYFHHPRYGHVLTRFDYRPMLFVHNNVQFFCYNGHFFRYRPGVGYILVDLPFGFTFRYLPAGYYERVYINGFAYFRVGNLFFEASPYGYSLVHYPERYYAYDDGYERPGFYYDDVYW